MSKKASTAEGEMRFRVRVVPSMGLTYARLKEVPPRQRGREALHFLLMGAEGMHVGAHTTSGPTTTSIQPAQAQLPPASSSLDGLPGIDDFDVLP